MRVVSAALLAGIVGCVFVQLASAADAAKYREKVLYVFCGQANCTDGANPYASLIQVNGTLYGTTYIGGNSDDGTVFSFEPSTGAETVLHSFASGSDGANPSSTLLDVKGTLYGTTAFGGSGGGGQGTIFSIDPGTGKEKVRYSFCSATDCSDGSNPVAGVIAMNGTLYGTTETGGTGSEHYGTAYSFDPTTGAESVLYSFCSQPSCTDGWNPNPALMYLSGTLYGVTIAGGAYSAGTAFSLNPGTGAETVLHSFGGAETEGAGPEASLIAVNGMLYGTTYQGGGAGCSPKGCGTVFSINPNTGAETVLYAFQGGSDGASPIANLIDVNGRLLGTTQAGGGTGCGGKGCGTVFSFDQSTGVETVLYAFMGGTDGTDPTAALISIDGTLYGTTSAGGGTGCGGAGCGTVFKLKKKR